MSPQTMKRSLRGLRDYVARNDNDFLWTGWQDRVEALADLDATVAAIDLSRKEGVKRGRLLLSRGGPLQQLARSSGWEEEYRVLIGKSPRALAAQ